MTTRDLYAAHALQGLFVGVDDPNIDACVSIAVAAAESLAEFACERWGHEWSVESHPSGFRLKKACERCGKVE